MVRHMGRVEEARLVGREGVVRLVGVGGGWGGWVGQAFRLGRERGVVVSHLGRAGQESGGQSWGQGRWGMGWVGWSGMGWVERAGVGSSMRNG